MSTKPKDIRRAVVIYYENLELSTANIRELFGVSVATAARLKKIAREQMAKDNVLPWSAQNVDTACAYKAWHLDIDELEKRCKKLGKITGKEYNQ